MVRFVLLGTHIRAFPGSLTDLGLNRIDFLPDNASQAKLLHMPNVMKPKI